MMRQKSILYGIVLVGCAFCVGGGCPPQSPVGPLDNIGDPEQAGFDALVDMAARLPDESLRAVRWLRPEETPEGSTFGILLEDGSKLYFAGTVNSEEEIDIPGIALYDSNDRFVLRQDLIDNGTILTLATGDGIRIETEGDGLRLGISLGASDPPSVIVATVDGQGNVEVVGSALEGNVDPTYTGKGDGSSRPLLFDKPTNAKKSEFALGCTAAGDKLVSLISLACDLRNLLTKKMPELALNALCIKTKLVIGLADEKDPNLKRVIPGFKLGLSLACSALKAAAQGLSFAGYIAKMNPVGLLCFALSPMNNGSKVVNGQSLAGTLCDVWLPQVPPDDDAFVPRGHFGEPNCPFGMTDVGGGLCCPADREYLWTDGWCRSTIEPGGCPKGFRPAGGGRCCPVDLPFFWEADGHCHGVPEDVGTGGCPAEYVPVAGGKCCQQITPYLWSDGLCHNKPESNIPDTICPPLGLVECTCHDKHYCLGIYCGGKLYHDAGTFCETFSCDE